VENDLGVAGGLEDRAVQLQALADLIRIDQVAVVDDAAVE
jgi:hypothetical protein